MTEQCKVCGFPHDGDSHSDCIFAQSKEIERLREQRRWIPESERLPDFGYRVLTWSFKYEIQIGRVDSYGGKKIFTDTTITHWMNLPEPPTMKQSNNDRTLPIP